MWTRFGLLLVVLCVSLPAQGESPAAWFGTHEPELVDVYKWFHSNPEVSFAENQELWSGRLMVIGQPAEERGAGARAMLDDGLFVRFPKPDYALALHVDALTAAGTVQVAGGFVLANVDSVDITVVGRGGHGSAPHTAIDPIVQAGEKRGRSSLGGS